MEKKIEFRFEKLFALLGVFISILLFLFGEKWSITKEFAITTGLVLTFFPLAVAWIRFFIDQRIRQTEKRIDFMIRNTQNLLYDEIQRDKLDLLVSKSFLSILDKAMRHIEFDPEAVRGLRDIIEQVEKGIFSIDSILEIYRHDSKMINLLDENESYLATHLLKSNPEAIKNNTSSSTISAAFYSYIQSQYEACKRGVKIIRIYIVDNLSQLQSSNIIAHLDQLFENKIEVKIITIDKLDKNLNEDFVIIGDRVLGISIPKNGPMVRSDYYINQYGKKRKEFHIYKKYFDELESASVDYIEIRQKLGNYAYI